MNGKLKQSDKRGDTKRRVAVISQVLGSELGSEANSRQSHPLT